MSGARRSSSSEAISSTTCAWNWDGESSCAAGGAGRGVGAINSHAVGRLRSYRDRSLVDCGAIADDAAFTVDEVAVDDASVDAGGGILRDFLEGRLSLVDAGCFGDSLLPGGEIEVELDGFAERNERLFPGEVVGARLTLVGLERHLLLRVVTQSGLVRIVCGGPERGAQGYQVIFDSGHLERAISAGCRAVGLVVAHTHGYADQPAMFVTLAGKCSIVG